MNTNLVRNELLGYVKQEVIDEAIRRGAIIKKVENRITFWCIPTVEVLIGKDNQGRTLKNPIKTRQVSQKYLDFKRELKTGRLKINPKETLL